MAEWSKAHAWNACRRETVSRVRIPVSPPYGRPALDGQSRMSKISKFRSPWIRHSGVPAWQGHLMGGLSAGVTAPGNWTGEARRLAIGWRWSAEPGGGAVANPGDSQGPASWGKPASSGLAASRNLAGEAGRRTLAGSRRGPNHGGKPRKKARCLVRSRDRNCRSRLMETRAANQALVIL